MSLQKMALVLGVLNLMLLAFLAANREVGAQAVPAVIRGRALELVDERGQVRTRINVEQDGEVVLRMIDQRGTIRVKLGAGESGSGLLLADEATEPGIHLIARRSATADRPNTTAITVRAGTREQVIRP